VFGLEPVFFIFVIPQIIIFHPLKQSVLAFGALCAVVGVRVAARQTAVTQPAEILPALGTSHLVTTVHLLLPQT